MKTTRGGPARLNVLFIGNSFTARNDLPNLVSRLADARGRELSERLINVGGASLRNHWNKGEAQQAIAKGKYDYVVLQEQSTLPVKNPKRTHENIRLFDEVIKAAGSKTTLYLTWARKNAPEAQDVISQTYRSIGQEIGATMIPAGIAWQKLLHAHEKPALHDRDGSHPSMAGSFLAACVAYAVLFVDTSTEPQIGVEGLTAADTLLLVKTAVSVVKEMD